jgi:3-deoxy-D-manno-octulosonic-acid transferase
VDEAIRVATADDAALREQLRLEPFLNAFQRPVEVRDAGALAARLQDWLADPAARRKTAMAGQRIVDALGGALERTLTALEPYLRRLKPRGGAGDA